MKCPNCGSTMKPRWLHRDDGQTCAACGGIWLDKDALDEFYGYHVLANVHDYPKRADPTGAFTQIVPTLIDSLRSDDSNGRYRAVRAIAAIGPDAAAAVPALTDLLLKEPWLAELAAQALGCIGPPAAAAVDALGTVMLQHAGAGNWAHLYAATALGRLGSARAVPYLMEAARDPDMQSPGPDAICSLGDLGPLARDAVPLLAELLEDRRFHREVIVLVLGEIGPADGQACDVILRTLKRTRSTSLRESAVNALYDVLFSGGDPPHHLLAVFKRLLKDRDRDVRRWASTAVDHLHDLGYE